MRPTSARRRQGPSAPGEGATLTATSLIDRRWLSPRSTGPRARSMGTMSRWRGPSVSMYLHPVIVASRGHQARNRRPANAPTPTHMRVASGYQVATNSGKSVGAMGGIQERRNARGGCARERSGPSGMDGRASAQGDDQRREDGSGQHRNHSSCSAWQLCPTSRDIHSFGGTTMSSDHAAPRARRTARAARAQAPAAWRRGGRAAASAKATAGRTQSESTNFSSEAHRVRMAAATSGLGPSSSA